MNSQGSSASGRDELAVRGARSRLASLEAAVVRAADRRRSSASRDTERRDEIARLVADDDLLKAFRE